MGMPTVHVNERFRKLRIENERLKKELTTCNQILDELINNVVCLCSGGPGLMQPQSIYSELINDAKRARQKVEEESMTMTTYRYEEVIDKLSAENAQLKKAYRIAYNAAAGYSIFCEENATTRKYEKKT